MEKGCWKPQDEKTGALVSPDSKIILNLWKRGGGHYCVPRILGQVFQFFSNLFFLTVLFFFYLNF